MNVAIIGAGPHITSQHDLAEAIARAKAGSMIFVEQGTIELVTAEEVAEIQRRLNNLRAKQSLQELIEEQESSALTMVPKDSFVQDSFVPRSKHQKKSHERPYKFHR